MPRLLALLLLLLALPSTAQPVTVAIDLDPLFAEGLATDGIEVGLRGDTAPLSWDDSFPLPDDDGDGVFVTTLDFSTGTGPVAYKAVVQTLNGELRWEQGENRLLLPGRMEADRRAFDAPQSGLPELTVSARELEEDLTLLHEALDALHPGLHLHATEETSARTSTRLAQRSQTLSNLDGEGVPLSEVYLIVAERLAAIRDGHTHLNPFNQEAVVRGTLLGRPDRVPFAFRLLDRRLVVTGDATPDGVLPPGTEVLTLDGHPVTDILNSLFPYVRSDGGNDGKRLQLLEVSGLAEAPEVFDILFPLVYSAAPTLALTVRLPDGAERALSVSRTTADERRARLLERDPTLPRSYDDALAFRFLDAPSDTAYLKVGTFVTYKMETDFEAWLVERFQSLREADTRHLIVDLRGNEGGMDDAAELLFRHLLTEPVDVDRWGSVTAYERVPEPLRPHVRSWDNAFLDLTSRVTPRSDGLFDLSLPLTQRVEPAPDAFTGSVFALVDAAASSATFYLARQLQRTGAAVLVGQETGGSLRGLNGGQVAFLTLPHSRLVVDIPLIGARPAEPDLDRGIRPDLPYSPTVEDMVRGRDGALETALAEIQ